MFISCRQICWSTRKKKNLSIAKGEWLGGGDRGCSQVLVWGGNVSCVSMCSTFCPHWTITFVFVVHGANSLIALHQQLKTRLLSVSPVVCWPPSPSLCAALLHWPFLLAFLALLCSCPCSMSPYNVWQPPSHLLGYTYFYSRISPLASAPAFSCYVACVWQRLATTVAKEFAMFSFSVDIWHMFFFSFGFFPSDIPYTTLAELKSCVWFYIRAWQKCENNFPNIDNKMETIKVNYPRCLIAEE